MCFTLVAGWSRRHVLLAQALVCRRKNKSFRPRERAKKGLKNLQSVKTLAGRTAPAGKRKQPLTVAAQFQHSLAALMETLNQANPFFIRYPQLATTSLAC